MRRRDKSGFFALQLLGDGLIALVSIVGAFHLRFQVIDARNWEPFWQISGVLFLLAIILVYFFQSNRCGERSRMDCIYESWIVFLILAVFTMAISFFTRGFAYPRSVIGISFLVQSVVVVPWKHLMFYFHRRMYADKSMLVFGSQEENERILTKLLATNPTERTRIFVHELNDTTLAFLEAADEVVITAQFPKRDLIRMCMDKGVPVSMMPSLEEVNLLKTELKQIGDVPLLAIKPLELTRMQEIQKRLFDVLISMLALLLLSPLFLGVAIAVAWEDGFPVIYRQTRFTKGGKTFLLAKFRTMVKDAEKQSGPILAEENDPRITRVGRLLRRTRLDELPQLANVLAGQMSLVGPRPERPHFIERYVKDLPEFSYRTRVKAGITGLGQIMGRYTTDPKDKLIFDLIYIRNYTMLTDLKICVRTLRVLASKTSANGIGDKLQARSVKDVYHIHEGEGYFSINGERN